MVTDGTPAHAASSYKVTIATVSDRTPHVGDVVRFTGRLTGRTVKATVALQRRWKGHSAWTTVSTVEVTSTGRFSATDVVTATTDRYYRTYKAAETGRKKDVSSSVFVNVSAKVGTITIAAVADNQLLAHITGKVNSSGGTVTLRDRAAGARTWHSEQLGGIEPDGTFDAMDRYPQGLHEFQAYRAATKTTTSATSRIVTVKIHDGVTVVSQKVLPFTTRNVSDSDRLVCYVPLITTKGVNGLLTTYADGSFLRKEPVTQVQQVGTKPCSSSAPALTSVGPDSGRLAGGGVITLTGAGLASVTAVTFTPIAKPSWTISGDGVMPALPAAFDSSSDTSLKVTVPQGLGGATTITVTSALGKATTNYTYVATWREPSRQEQQFLDAVNRWRVAGYQCYGDGVVYKGAALTWNGQWADVMESHSIDMVRRYPAYQAMAAAHYDNWLHNAPNVVPTYRLAFSGLSRGGGEVAQGEFGSGSGVLTPSPIDPQDAADAFVYSGGHCAILLNPNMTQLGAGQAYGMGDAKTTTAYWTALAG